MALGYIITFSGALADIFPHRRSLVGEMIFIVYSFRRLAEAAASIFGASYQARFSAFRHSCKPAIAFVKMYQSKPASSSGYQ